MLSEEQQQALRTAVEGVMSEHGWSLMGAQIATGVGRGVINNLRQGVPPTIPYVIRWADALTKGRPLEEVFAARSKWLKLAGYEYMIPAEELARMEAAGAGVTVPTPEETRDPIFDELVEAGFAELPAEDREELVELARLKYARLQRKKTIGSRARTEDEERADRAHVRGRK